MSQQTKVQVQLAKNIQAKPHLSHFCAELKDHILAALSDLLEPDEYNSDISITTGTTSAIPFLTINVELYLIHPEVYDDIHTVVRETVAWHHDTYKPV